MFKKLQLSFFLLTALLAITVNAADINKVSGFDWHAPELKKDIQKQLIRHVKDQKSSIGFSVAAGATTGLALPWLASFALGAGYAGKNTKGVSDTGA